MSLLRVVVESDDDAKNPRGWDNLGTMTCFHRNYHLGDVHDYEDSDEMFEKLARLVDKFDTIDKSFTSHQYSANEKEKSWSIVKALVEKHYIKLPLYLYDHSGITMNTTGFSCGWDSGKVGFIYVAIDDAKREYGWKRLTAARRFRLEGYLKGEVKTFDQYLTGDVYAFRIEEYELDEDGDEDIIDRHVDGCSGFYSEEDALAEGELRLEDAIEADRIKIEKSTFPVSSLGV